MKVCPICKSEDGGFERIAISQVHLQGYFPDGWQTEESERSDTDIISMDDKVKCMECGVTSFITELVDAD